MSYTNASSKGKKCPAPAQGRAKLVKQRREEESKRIQLANQKRITDWVSKAERKREDKEKERRQLEAMRRKKEESARRELSILHKIPFSQSLNASKILNLPPPTPTKDIEPAASPPPAFPIYQESPETPLLPFPTLSSSLKTEVLKDVAKKIVFQPQDASNFVPAAPKPCIVEGEGSPSKELQLDERKQSSVLSSQEQGDQPTGNGSLGESHACDKK